MFGAQVSESRRRFSSGNIISACGIEQDIFYAVPQTYFMAVDPITAIHRLSRNFYHRLGDSGGARGFVGPGRSPRRAVKSRRSRRFDWWREREKSKSRQNALNQ